MILQEGSLDVRPIGICSHGDEEVRFAAITTDCHGVLEELIHVACASLVCGGKDNALTLLSKIDRLVGMNSILKALIEVCAYLLLMCPDPIQVALLDGYPGINQVLLEEFASIEEDVWLSGSMHGTVCIVAALGDVLGELLTIGTKLGWDIKMEARVTFREQHDIVQWSVAVVEMTDPGKTTSLEAKDNVAVEVDMFFTTSRDDGSNLIDSGSIVPAQVCVWIDSDAEADVLLFLCRLLPEDLMGLLVHLNIGVVFKQHDMEVSHGGWQQV